MVKHNNVVPNAHFHKDWQDYVKTWFSQPIKKKARRVLRDKKALRVAPRPVELLRPIVRGQTIKYNAKVHAGRGFSLDELKAAGINRLEARGIGIAVDHRRRNKSEEGFQQNVERLKLYKSKLVIFPRNPSSKKVKKGDSSKEERASVGQAAISEAFPIKVTLPKIKARKITEEERKKKVAEILFNSRLDAHLKGRRDKALKDKASEAAGKKSKKADDDDFAAE